MLTLEATKTRMEARLDGALVLGCVAATFGDTPRKGQ
jgi:hypothetical protein